MRSRHGDRWIRLVATVFYAGEVPWVSGTIGSFIGLLIYISAYPCPLLTAFIFGAFLALGFFSAGPAEKIFGKKDPRQVVIDEVCGIFLVFWGLPLVPLTVALGFLAYRLFDIFKPLGVRRLEKLGGSLGIMADDLLCGLYANAVLRALLFFHILKV
jgi:phosphatidylglycerophosphatase A